MKRREFLMTAAGAALVGAHQATVFGQARAYTLNPAPLGKTLLTPDGRAVFDYMTQKPAQTEMSANSVCCFYPLHSPGGQRLTVFGVGHRHYRGVYFGWHTIEFRELIPAAAAPPAGAGRGGAGGGPPPGGAAGQAPAGGRAPAQGGPPRVPAPPPSPEALARQNGPTRGNVIVGDYWGWGRYALLTGRIIKNRSVELVKSDANSAQLEMQNDWTVQDQVMMREALTAMVREVPGAFVLDLTYRFSPNNCDVVLPEWSFGGLCVSGRSDAQSPYYFSPEGRQDQRPMSNMVDGNSSWPESPWYARTHVLDGKTAGYAVVNHASNPKTRWWTQPNTGNIQPSIVTYGDFRIPNDQPLTLKYRVVAYDGEFSPARVEQLSSEWREA